MRTLRYKFTTILYIFSLCFLASCRLSQHVPKGQYRLKGNVVAVKGDAVIADGVPLIVRQQPNFKTVGLQLKLFVWNRTVRLDNRIQRRELKGKRTFIFYKKSIDTKRRKKNKISNGKNIERSKKANATNEKRISRARAKGEENYTEVIPKLIDTLLTRKFFREWKRDKYGEKPVIFDSLLYVKSQEQIQAYLKRKGFHFPEITPSIKYNQRKQTAVCTYAIKTGDPFVIDSIFLKSDVSWFALQYKRFERKEFIPIIIGQHLDEDMLDEHRSKIAKAMRDEGYYGFLSSNISYLADTIPGTKRVTLVINHLPRVISEKRDGLKDTAYTIQHQTYEITDVFFHIMDTSLYKGNFTQACLAKGIDVLDEKQRINTLDMLYVKGPKARDKDKERYKREMYLMYNGKSNFKADILDFQNLLENDFYFRDKYVDRTYTNLTQIGVFKSIEAVYVEDVKNSKMVVHYYLAPAKKQTFGFDPRMTNSNGFLGLAAGFNWTNKNLFGRAERLTTSISGGLESQPEVFEGTEKDEKKAGRSFNTFEFGPSVKLEFPWFFPIKILKLEKRQKSRAIIQTGYNYQKRADFERGVFNVNNSWYFEVDKAQEVQFGLPFLSGIRFVNITRAQTFDSIINVTNDLFLRNSYSDQFIWSDFMIKYTYQNMKKDKENRKIKFPIYFKTNFDLAGLSLSWFKLLQDVDPYGVNKVLGIPYAKFWRLDLEYKAYLPVLKKSTLALRSFAGLGKTYATNVNSLPFDFGFFGGGANDNRGFRARSMTPGNYENYLDSNRVATQIGDVQLSLNAELRFPITSLIKGALFLDAGNIWTSDTDPNRVGSKFTKDFYKQLTLATGIGFRFDLSFFIIRLDIGIPLRNPSYPTNAQWIWDSRQGVIDRINAYNIAKTTDYEVVYNPRLFQPQLHFGIGLPF